MRFKLRGSSVDIETIPHVTRSSVTGDAVELFTMQPEAVLREVFARNLEVTDLEVKGGGLEEAFIELTSSQTARA